MALILEIKVVPSSGRADCVLDKQGAIKCYLISSPQKGKANKELVVMLSKKFKLPQQAITIIAGATARKKRIKIEQELQYGECLEALGLAVQKTVV